MNDSRLTSLHQTLPTLRLKTEPADLQHYGRDWTRRFTPAPLAIALPATVQEVQAIVRWANDAHIAIVPSGGRTGLSGGAMATNGELVLSLERMNKMLQFDPMDRTMTVQAGMPLEAVKPSPANTASCIPSTLLPEAHAPLAAPLRPMQEESALSVTATPANGSLAST